MNWQNLAHARDLLKAGKAVAIPTETVYGLAARIDQEPAVREIFTLKERPFFDPLIVHVADFIQVDSLVESWPPLALFLAIHFWPGPLTLVMRKSEKVNSLITSGLETVAVRMPAHPFARRLIRTVGVPLAAPSANKFGKTSPTEAQHVKAEFGSQVFVVDGGACRIGLESTVVRVEKNRIVLLRPGSITVEMIQQLTRKWAVPVEITAKTDQASPGHLEHHYMPRIPVVAVAQDKWPLSAAVIEQLKVNFNLKSSSYALLRLSDDPAQAARELYKGLREAAATPADFILAIRKPFHQGGGWTAIWDRLSRAATVRVGLEA